MPYPGFLYWGVFLACGAIVVAYLAWMRWVTKRDAERDHSQG